MIQPALKSFQQSKREQWINGEQFASYTDEIFVEKQRELNILPIKLKFIYTDLILFYKIVNKTVSITLPSYISVCGPEDVRYTRRNAPIHDLSDFSTYNCNITPSCDVFKNSYFYRSVHRWNKLPVSIRQVGRISSFKSMLTKFLWSADIDWPD